LRDRLLPAVMLAIMAVISPASAGDLGPKGAVAQQLAEATGGEGTLTAAVMPGIGREARVAPLPKPLSASDVDAYKRALRLQAEGNIGGADRELGKVKDDLLKGHVLAARYLAGTVKPKYQELRAWMAEYADMPQAEAIHKLGTAKGIKGFGAIKAPVRGYLQGTGIDTSDDGANWEDATYAADRGSAKARAVKTKFRALLKKNDQAAALAMLTGAEVRTLSRQEIDELKLFFAADHFAGGRDAEATAWATQVAERSGADIPAPRMPAGISRRSPTRTTLRRGWFPPAPSGPPAPIWCRAAPRW
jgi:soluble lytic murein transglycosylase